MQNKYATNIGGEQQNDNNNKIQINRRKEISLQLWICHIGIVPCIHSKLQSTKRTDIHICGTENGRREHPASNHPICFFFLFIQFEHFGAHAINYSYEYKVHSIVTENLLSFSIRLNLLLDRRSFYITRWRRNGFVWTAQLDRMSDY